MDMLAGQVWAGHWAGHDIPAMHVPMPAGGGTKAVSYKSCACACITIDAQLYSLSGAFNVQGRSYGYHMSHLLLDRREGVLHGLGVKGQVIPVIHGVAPDLTQLAPALQNPFHLRQQCKGRVDVLTLT